LENIDEVINKKNEYKRVYEASDIEIKKRLESLAESLPRLEGSALVSYKWLLEKERMIHMALNLFVVENTWYVGTCWCPKNKRDEIDSIITNLRENKKMQCSNLKEMQNLTLTPPTKLRTNEFFNSFNDIIEYYGIPAYREINPVIFITITFPFLFGIMFGDIAHGTIITTFSTYLVLNKNSIDKFNSMTKSLLKYRYLLLLSGIFSIFGGIITNDFAGFPIYLTRSCFKGDRNEYGEYYTKITNCVYPFGIDPRWVIASNSLQYLNSYRMKLGLLIGTIQMLLGVILKGLNLLYFDKQIELLLNYLPQVILITSFLGYMAGLIIVKWLTNWEERIPPSIITCLINIFISNESEDNGSFFENVKMEVTANKVLFGIICFSTVSMMVMRPIYLYTQRYAEASGGMQEIQIRPYEAFIDNEQIKKDEELQDKCLESILNSIEFGLGLFSSTASYLRLWALSLSHSELSFVFFEMTLGLSFYNESYTTFYFVTSLSNVIDVFIIFNACWYIFSGVVVYGSY